MFFKGARCRSQGSAAGAPKPVVFVDLPEVLVNLSSAGSERAQYLKVKIVLELPDQAMVAQIQPVMPRVMDAFQTYLRELRAERSRRLRRALPAQGRADAPRQRRDRAQPDQRRAVQGNHRAVTA